MALLRPTEDGLYCEAGGFHIDPWRPVRRAIVTHAHSDHASPGSESYLCSPSGAGVLRARLGAVVIQTVSWGEPLRIGDVTVSLHPAGHILGSAQVRIERPGRAQADDGGRVWVFSGDYKDVADPTCEPFEPVACDTFLTESTFGLPIYSWPDPDREFAALNEWWRACASRGRTAVVYAYALGKAQRVLARLEPSIGPIRVHGALVKLNEAYHQAGIVLPVAPRLAPENLAEVKGAGIVLAPPSARGTPWLRKLAGPDGIEEAFASGWMRVRGARRWRSVDRGFVISDHADWPGLLRSIQATGCRRVGVTHGYSSVLARFLGEQGYDTFTVPTRYEGEAVEKQEPSAEPAPGTQGDAGEAP